LTRALDRHLDDNEVDALVSSLSPPGASSEKLSAQAIGEAQRHVESCHDCHRKVQMHEFVQSEISRRERSADVPAGPGCMDVSGWTRVVSGLLPRDETTELMRHAVQCAHCGPLLRAAVEIVSDDATPSEETLVAGLNSARPEWQRRMAQMLGTAVTPRPTSREGRWRLGELLSWNRLVIGATALALVLVGCWFALRTLRPPSVDQLLAQAYVERRTIEVRIPGATYAPLRVERSGGGSNIDKPEPLLKAEALIGEHLRKSPNDPVWLQAKARADLLDGNYDSGITTLQRALEIQPGSLGLLIDLGSAYLVRAKSADRAIDYGNAVEYLGRALAKSPNDPVALFNQALACEKIFLYTQAVDDWEHYLRVDPQGGWADEARQHLAIVKQKAELRERGFAERLLTPEEIANTSGSGAVLNGRINDRIEEYQKLALTDWLLKAFSATALGNSREAQVALSSLATVARDEHHDSWFDDFLAHTSGVQFPGAIEALAASILANEHGDYVAAKDSAQTAAELFRRASNPAGELRAKAEEVYSDHLLWEGKRCMALLRSLDEPLKRKSYTWLRAQMSLEQSNCADLVGDLGTYQAAIGRATQEAKAGNYPGLFLRGLGFQSLATASLGDASSSFSLASKGLALFWSSRVDLMKGYNLYTDLDAAADGLRLPNLQVSLWREATGLIDQDPNVLLRAMAHRWYGNAAYLADAPQLAALEFSNASALFAASPQTAATTRDRMDAEVWLAQIEIRQGDVEQATARLRGIQSTLASTPSFEPEIGFYSAQADISMQRADSGATASALQVAIFLAEWALHSFPSEADRHRWAEQTNRAYRDVVEWKLRQGEASSALEFWEWYRGAELRATERKFSQPMKYVDMDNPPDPRDAPSLPSPSVVTNRLRFLRDDTVIAYGAFSDGLAVWAYDDRGVFSRWIPTPLPAVQESVARFVRLCSDPSSDLVALRIAGRALYDLLIAPIEGRLVPGRTILFEPDDFLDTVPLEALVDSSGHYLAERFAVITTPGLYRTLHLREATPITSDTRALIVSVPAVSEEGLTPLADAENEAQTVAGRFSSPRWLQGGDATLSTIRREIRGAVVFHFAGHAVASPLRSGLVLAEDDPNTQYSRLIGPDSFASVETAQLQLAVLSACRTAADNQVAGSGIENLAQALLEAGVPHVVASRWNVDSSETAKFMNRFYTQLLAGDDVVSSMHTAQLALVSRSESAHPYYWSAFELQGIR
jgi:CHAT domain-containing protein/tetratricopeptide (TPR) repeat protein